MRTRNDAPLFCTDCRRFPRLWPPVRSISAAAFLACASTSFLSNGADESSDDSEDLKIVVVVVVVEQVVVIV